ncbi:MAG: hypothetical protein WBM44_17320 [Waterburya sp.]
MEDIQQDIQQKILSAVHDFFEQNKNKPTGDKEISDALQIDIDRVRSCLKYLGNKGYIKLISAANVKEPERVIVSNITSEGRIAIKDNL